MLKDIKNPIKCEILVLGEILQIVPIKALDCGENMG